ncbi:hypothetical protein [Bdellovibrio sp. HCB2-146]|uniref:hypothetical protein n=1 Tax=Bdellovibrio sp. HCB2-146 TaxID=3394362 RepID=UPI0039BD45C9
MEDIFKDFSVESIRFSKRPQSLAANDRLQWKMSLVLMILSEFSRKETCSLRKMNLLIWGIQFEQNHFELLRIISGNDRALASSVKFDPGLPRVLVYMSGAGLLFMKNSKYALTAQGRVVGAAIKNNKEIFRRERSILGKIPGADLTEANIERALKNG